MLSGWMNEWTNNRFLIIVGVYVGIDSIIFGVDAMYGDIVDTAVIVGDIVSEVDFDNVV